MEDELYLPADPPFTPVTVAPVPPKFSGTGTDHQSRKLTLQTVGGEFGMASLLKDMKYKSGLTTRQVATKMGIQRTSLNQYLWGKVGRGGTSQLSWFLRFAEATGYRLYLTSPSLKEQYELQAVEESKPAAQKTQRI